MRSFMAPVALLVGLLGKWVFFPIAKLSRNDNVVVKALFPVKLGVN